MPAVHDTSKITEIIKNNQSSLSGYQVTDTVYMQKSCTDIPQQNCKADSLALVSAVQT